MNGAQDNTPLYEPPLSRGNSVPFFCWAVQYGLKGPSLFHGLHWHENSEVVFLTKGAMSVQVADAFHHIEPGSLILVQPRQIHAILDYAPHTEGIVAKFDPSAVIGSLNNQDDPMGIPNQKTAWNTVYPPAQIKNPETANLLRKAAIAYRGQRLGYQLEVKGCLLLLLHHLMQTSYSQRPVDRTPNPSPQDLSQTATTIKTYVDANLDQDIVSGEVAQAAKLSYRSLARLMNREFQMPLSNYILTRRIREAERLLLTTSLSVKEISFRCGFTDPGYFSRAFRQMKGISPSAFRARGKEGVYGLS